MTVEDTFSHDNSKKIIDDSKNTRDVRVLIPSSFLYFSKENIHEYQTHSRRRYSKRKPTTRWRTDQRHLDSHERILLSIVSEEVPEEILEESSLVGYRALLLDILMMMRRWGLSYRWWKTLHLPCCPRFKVTHSGVRISYHPVLTYPAIAWRWRVSLITRPPNTLPISLNFENPSNHNHAIVKIFILGSY